MQEKLSSTDVLGEPLFISRSSKIYKWKENQLIKLFNEGIGSELIDNEEINSKETFSRGISSVKCYGQISVGTQTGLIIEKIPGMPLISLAGAKPLTAFNVPKLMAQLQLAMHETQTEVIRSYKDMVREALKSEPLDFLSVTERAMVDELLQNLPDGNSILHLDFHPDNIMSDTKATSIIDWMTAARGVPAADVAATLFLLNEGEMIPGFNRITAAVLEGIRKTICRNYLKQYKKASGICDEEITCWRLPFMIVRLGLWNIESERETLKQKIKDAILEINELECK